MDLSGKSSSERDVYLGIGRVRDLPEDLAIFFNMVILNEYVRTIEFINCGCCCGMCVCFLLNVEEFWWLLVFRDSGRIMERVAGHSWTCWKNSKKSFVCCSLK
jgi:hypothetical protein